MEAEATEKARVDAEATERARVEQMLQGRLMLKQWQQRSAARGYNRQKALLDPRVAAVLHYTADENAPVLRHTKRAGGRAPGPASSSGKQKGSIPTHP